MRFHFAFLSALLASMLLSVTLTARTAFASRNSYFDMTSTQSPDLQPFPKWTGTMARFDDQRNVPDNECGNVRYHPCVLKEWREMLELIEDESLESQLEMINQWGNKHPYIVDQLNWGMEDYWETPYEFMEVNGDCEDYAIAKYYSLRALGISPDQLRVIIVQDFNLGGIIHAILGVYNEDDELFILDNQSQQVLPALRIYHYRPIYGVNEQSWWAYYPK